jgi:hypothetical protein
MGRARRLNRVMRIVYQKGQRPAKHFFPGMLRVPSRIRAT